MSDWSWKAKGGATGKLLYEPGNWGDFLKALWISATLRWLRRNAPENDPAGVSCVDVFAGAPSYPISPKTLRRLRQCHSPELARLARPYLDQGLWPGSSTLMADLLEQGTAEDGRATGQGAARVSSFDADAERYAALAKTGRFGMLAGASGWEALAGAEAGPWSLVLVDPYDWLAEWRERLADLLQRADAATTLVYLYNRSPRGAEAFKEYRAFKGALDDAWGERPKRLGRVAADTFLPSAWHEMMILPGAAARAHPAFGELLTTLEQATARLAEAVRAAETMEE